MKQLRINLENDILEALAMKIDDSMPTVKAVARQMLMHAGDKWREVVGYRKPCQCSDLQRAAENPDLPVVFDTLTNEYHIVHKTAHGEGQLIIRYCFFCGGTAPISKRGELFAWVPIEEKHRLTKLCESRRTFDDAITTFGEPQHDMSSGQISESQSDAGGRKWTAHRVIVYSNLSNVADVHFTQKSGDRVSPTFQGKYIGPKAEG